MNLYDMSVEAGLKLSDDVLLAFALALVTDTSILRTASSEEMEYLSYFLNGRKMEEVLELAFGDVVDPERFSSEVSRVEEFEGNLKMCLGDFADDEAFLFFVDTFMYVMRCDIVIGRLDWGCWVYAKKEFVQKVYPVLKEIEQLGYKRRGGRIFGLRKFEIILEKLLNIS